MTWSPISSGRQVGGQTDPAPGPDDLTNPTPDGPIDQLYREEVGVNRAGAFVSPRMELTRGEWVTVATVNLAARQANAMMRVQSFIAYENERVTSRVWQAMRLIEGTSNVIATRGTADELVLSSEVPDPVVSPEPVNLQGLWSPGDNAVHSYSLQVFVSKPIFWLLARMANRLVAFEQDGSRNYSRDIWLDVSSEYFATACDGQTVWVADTTANLLRAFFAVGPPPSHPLGLNSSSHVRDTSRDIDIDLANSPQWRGATIAGTTMWVIDFSAGADGNHALAFSLLDGTRITGDDIDLGEGSFQSCCNDGETLWFVDDFTDMARAYRVSTQARRSAYDISLPTPLTGNAWLGATVANNRIMLIESRPGVVAGFERVRMFNATTRARVPSEDFQPIQSIYDGMASDQSKVYASVGSHIIVEEL